MKALLANVEILLAGTASIFSNSSLTEELGACELEKTNMTSVGTILKCLLALLLLLVLTALLTGLWLRFEFERVKLEALNSHDWATTPVLSLGDQQQTRCKQQYPEKKAWFGGLHIHTSASYDATSFGSLTTSDDAYRFGRGEPLSLALRQDPANYTPPQITISSPLDFMAVTDHAEALGETKICYEPASDGYNALVCKVYRGDIRLPVEERFQALVRLVSFAIFGQDQSVRICGPDGSACRERAATVWQANQRSTEAFHDYSENCEFTTFHAYEYTLAKESSNLHRNVVFKNSTVPQHALSAKGAREPEVLLRWLDALCVSGNPDCDVLAIPHNSNWSSGRMWFPYSNQDLSLEEQKRLALLRSRMEPLAEIMQVKGDSECRNGIASVFGKPDEFCNFEKLRKPDEEISDCGEEIGSGGMMLKGCISRYSYVRYALTAGLIEQAKLGTNPFKLGIVAATDTHNGAPAAGREKGHLGSHGTDRSVLNRLLGEVEVPGEIAKGSPVRYSPGGIAGIYAQENSREALFEAMHNRETFGTSGPRITPRFFAGWDVDEGICSDEAYPGQAYVQGVPMGSDLPPPSQPRADGPVFVASAHADSREGSNLLQRIQVIKGWVDSEGRRQQAVIDIAGDGNNGASVDPSSCAVSGPGFRQLCTTWRDPDFDSDVAAVYYVRVLENPSCRWSHYDCLSLPENERPASCSDPDLPWKIQERAWTSPIWYTPNVISN
jgi:hypothetical protein